MTSLYDLAGLPAKLCEGRVTCLGDLMLDRFVYGKVERISPEAPIPVVKVTHENSVLGGLGNVVRNLSSLGAATVVHSVVGDDSAGNDVRTMLTELPRCEPRLTVERGLTTTIKTRIVAGAQQVVRVDRESSPVDPDTVSRHLLNEFRQSPRDPVVIISDYGKGALTPETTTTIIADAVRAGQTVIVDPKGRDYARYRGASCVTPNRSELHQAAGLPVGTHTEIIAAARSLIAKYDFQAVLATLSERGMLLVTATTTEFLPAEVREVFDVSGAGDTVVAVLAAATAVGIPLVDAARLANTAGGIVVGKTGTATVTADELSRALQLQDPHEAVHNILSRTLAVEQVQRWKQQSLSVGFTNGCFDLLHPGHVTLLAKAAAHVDRLIVGLNSDESVRRLKGPSRPVQNELVCATVLASLSSVAMVTIFDEETPLELIQALKPGVLFKGADYTLATVVGAEVVRSYGGEVILIDLVPQQSTTRLVQRMAASDSDGRN